MRLLGWVVFASAAAALSGTLKKDILKKLYFDVEQNAKGIKDLYYIALMNRKSKKNQHLTFACKVTNKLLLSFRK